MFALTKTFQPQRARSFSFLFRDQRTSVHTGKQILLALHPATTGFPCSPASTPPSCRQLNTIQGHDYATMENFLNKDDAMNDCQSHDLKQPPSSNPHADDEQHLAQQRT